MSILTEFSLKNHNTFGIDQTAAAFVVVDNITALKNSLQHPDYPEKFILGGGSNLLLTQPLNALCIHINLKGIAVVEETEEEVIVEAQAGENWHAFVCWTLEKGYGGLENLSLIPGNVGTAPIQNIGAYGVELKDVFDSCTALHRTTLTHQEFTTKEAEFGYRSSYFKTKGKDKFVICAVRFRLTKRNHRLATSYGAIKSALGNTPPSPQSIAKAVIAIRQSKLPDPAVLGNSGSFFKNPVLTKDDFNRLQKEYPALPHYPQTDGTIKVPAGWLIDTLGFKGKRQGDAGVHEHQALVLVNHGNAQGKEILALAQEIQAAVNTTFGIALEAEVNIL